jgi:uncharacterized membrane protein YdcZ (DUF606 family)
MKRNLLILCLACLLLTAAGLASDAEIPWYSFTGGGGQVITGIYSLDSAIGQPIVGINSASPYELCAGYLCVSIIGSQIFLPLLIR